MTPRRYADYEYDVGPHRVRVERYGDGWRYMVFWADGSIAASTDDGEMFTLKRDAKAAGIAAASDGEAR